MAWFKHPRQNHATWILHPSHFGYTLDLGRHPRSIFDAQGHHHPRILNANSRGQSWSPRSWICRIGIDCGMDVDLAFDVYASLPRRPPYNPFLSGPVCSRRIDMVAWCILYSDVSVDNSHDFWYSEICHFSHSFTMVLPSIGCTRPDINDHRSGCLDPCRDHVVWDNCSLYRAEFTRSRPPTHLTSTLDDALGCCDVLSYSD